jgi:streptogramin lyase
MSQHNWQQSILAIWSRERKRKLAARRRRRPVVEAMESRQLLSTIAEFPAPGAGPFDMVTGPDGNLWFTEATANKIAVINPSTHAVTDFAVPTANAEPIDITAGPDGNLWFTEHLVSKIGMINPSTHTITEFAIPTGLAIPQGITTGPDGKLWFTETGSDKIGVIDPSTHAISDFALSTHPANPGEIVAGPDGNLWFTELLGNKIGMINPSTHAITEFPLPNANSGPSGIVAGPDGNLWFAEDSGNRIGTINPTTHAIVETTLPTAGSEPISITNGPDGNLWFTELTSVRVGTINPITRRLTETPVPTASSRPGGIVAGPDGNLWFAEEATQKLGVLTPTLSLAATSEPPAFVATNAPFGLTVTVDYQSGLVDTGFNGNVTLALLNPNANGATLGGTLTVAAHNGIATFTGLTLNQVGSGYRLMASIDPLTTTLTTPVTVAVPPTIVTEKAIFAGKGKRRHLVGYELDFSTAMDPTRAASVADYTLTQSQRRGRQLVNLPVAFQAAYDATAHSVTLTLVGKPKFAQGGKLVVAGVPPGGLTDAKGVPLDGGNQGVIGDDGTFVIGPKGNTISR